MKYKIISADTIKNLIDFLDEIQFDAAGSKEKDDLHKVNFCSWAIQELLNSFNVSEGKINKKRKPNLFEKREEWNKLKGTKINYYGLIGSVIVAVVIGLIKYFG